MIKRCFQAKGATELWNISRCLPTCQQVARWAPQSVISNQSRRISAKNPWFNNFRHRIFSAISFNFPLSIIKFSLRRRETEWIDILRKPEIDANEVDERWERKRRRGRIFCQFCAVRQLFTWMHPVLDHHKSDKKWERTSASLFHDACTCRWPNAKKCCLRKEGRDWINNSLERSQMIFLFSASKTGWQKVNRKPHSDVHPVCAVLQG